MGATLTDANGNGTGSVSTAAGVAFYQGHNDGATVLNFCPEPYSLPIVFAGQSTQVPVLNPGLPGPTLPKGAALSTIGIVNTFAISPDDQIADNSFFQVVSAPEPSTLALFAISMVGLSGRRRR